MKRDQEIRILMQGKKSQLKLTATKTRCFSCDY